MNADPIEVSFLSSSFQNMLDLQATCKLRISGKVGWGMEKVSSENNFTSLVTGNEEDIWFW